MFLYKLLDLDKLPNISDQMAIYWEDLEKFRLFHK